MCVCVIARTSHSRAPHPTPPRPAPPACAPPAGDKVKPSFGRTGPGKRGRAASTSDASKWVIFGGLRQ